MVCYQAALLFWNLLSNTLEEWGFRSNQYDQCVVNKIINNKQCKVIWHVDDLKILHVDKEFIEGIITKLNSKFREERD